MEQQLTWRLLDHENNDLGPDEYKNVDLWVRQAVSLLQVNVQQKEFTWGGLTYPKSPPEKGGADETIAEKKNSSAEGKEGRIKR